MEELEEKNEKGEIDIYLVPKEKGFLGWMGALLSCYWCTGIWVSMLVFILRFYLPLLYQPVVIIFAAAGLAALIETIVQSRNIE